MQWVLKRYRPPKSHAPKESLFGGAQFQRKILLFSDMLVSAMPDPTNYNHEEMKNAMGWLSHGVEIPEWQNAQLQVLSHLMRRFISPLLNLHAKSVTLLFDRLVRVAKFEIRGSDSLGDMSHKMALQDQRIIYLIDQYFQNMLTNIMKDGAEALQLAVEPFKDTLMPNCRADTQRAVQELRTTGMCLFARMITEIGKQGVDATPLLSSPSMRPYVEAFAGQAGGVNDFLQELQTRGVQQPPQYALALAERKRLAQENIIVWGSGNYEDNKNMSIDIIRDRAIRPVSQMQPTARRMVPREQETQQLKETTFSYVAYIMREIVKVVERTSNTRFLLQFVSNLASSDLMPTIEAEATKKSMHPDEYVASLSRVTQDIDLQIARIGPRIDEARRVLALAQRYVGAPMTKSTTAQAEQESCRVS